MAFKRGHCPQCGCRIMVKDSNGMLNGRMPNWCETEMVFEDGHRVRINMCADCIDQPDFEKIIDELTHDESEISLESVKKNLKRKNGKKEQIYPKKFHGGVMRSLF